MFDRRLLIISGKGGVGKSTLCSAFALSASRMGKRVLVIEMDEKERISRLFGTPEVGYEGAFVHPNIFVRNLLPMRVMDEFLETRVTVKTIARQILGSSIYKYFVAAAPGLKEFVTLGKIMLLEDEKEGRGKPKYDFIVIDAPATGHHECGLGKKAGRPDNRSYHRPRQDNAQHRHASRRNAGE